MPYPFADFDCAKYIEIPPVIKEELPIVSTVIKRALEQLHEEIYLNINMTITVREIICVEPGKQYTVEFGLISSHGGSNQQKYIEINVEL